ncbi:MAG: hypothetical protein Q9165_000515 [Trypethelium subeluteriae]
MAETSSRRRAAGEPFLSCTSSKPKHVQYSRPASRALLFEERDNHHIKHLASNQKTCIIPKPEDHSSASDSLFGEDLWIESDTTKRHAERTNKLHLRSYHDVSSDNQEVSITHIDNATMSRESNSKTQIYDYAAKFGLVPEFETFATRRGSKRIVTVTIRIADLGIEASATGTGLLQAEVGAALHFRRIVKKQKMVAPAVYSQALSTSTAEKFLEFYKSLHAHYHVSVHSRSDVPLTNDSNDRDLLLYAAVVVVNGQNAGEEVYFSSPKKAKAAAYLTAALNIIRQDPTLLDLFQPKTPQSIRSVYAPIIPTQKTRSALEPVALTQRKRSALGLIGPIDVHLDQETLDIMRNACQSFRNSGNSQTRSRFLNSVEKQEASRALPRPRLTDWKIEHRSNLLKKSQEILEKRTDLADILHKRAELPVRQLGSKVLEMVDSNQCSLIVSATGSGKTTQVPQLLLEQVATSGRGAKCNIICTQPRRIAAKSVAQRVAYERGESLQNTVGYQIRFDSRPPIFGGSITYCTTGILLAQLENAGAAALNDLSHIILDEVHERDTLIDFLMVVLKKAMAIRRQADQDVPRIVLMSATIDTHLFSDYFSNTSADGATLPCPFISVPGRLFPVREHFLNEILADLRELYGSEFDSLVHTDTATSKFLTVEERYTKNSAVKGQRQDPQSNDRPKYKHASDDEAWSTSNEAEDALVPIHLIGAVIANIVNESSKGAILVFMPGLDEILKVETLLRRQPIFGVHFTRTSQYKIMLLHSSLNSAQNEVFDPVPLGCRKIILATNIAETSITIPDVQFVVDSGKMRENHYSQLHRFTRLLTLWESKSNRKQRAGRAGRVKRGHYFGLFSRERYESFSETGVPELLRSDLQSICLSVKVQARDTLIQSFLADAFQPPTSEAVEASVKALKDLQALTEAEQLTPLGKVLAQLPIHPRLGRMIILSIIFQCLDPILITGAANEERPLFVRPLEARAAAIQAQAEFYEGTGSDQIALINAFRELRQMRDEKGQQAAEMWARRKYIHLGAFTTIDQTTRQIEDILVEAGLIPRTPPYRREYSELGPPVLNQNAGNVPVVKALLVAGFRPNLAVQSRGNTLKTASEPSTMIHPSSINRKRGPNGNLHYSIFTYASMVKSTGDRATYLRDTTVTTALISLLVGGKLEKGAAGIIEMDEWVRFSAPWDLMQFRDSLDAGPSSRLYSLHPLNSICFDAFILPNTAQVEGDSGLEGGGKISSRSDLHDLQTPAPGRTGQSEDPRTANQG